MKVEIAQIVVPNNRRPLKDVHQLADSIKDIGLLKPITVTNTNTSNDTLISTNLFDTFQLVAGFHRLEACKALDRQKVPAHIVVLDGLEIELAEIDENLIRSQLVILEHAEQLKRRKEIYEAIHPEIRYASSEQMKAIRRGDKLSLRQKPFAADAAQKTGVSPRTVQREVQIANRLPGEVKDIIRDKSIAANKTELIKLAKMAPARQIEVVQKFLSRQAKTVREAERKVRGESSWIISRLLKSMNISNPPKPGWVDFWKKPKKDCSTLPRSRNL